MKLIELLKSVGEVVTYKPEPVDAGTLDSILDVMSYTDSAANTRPWEIYLIKSDKYKQELDKCVLDSMLRIKESSGLLSEVRSLS